MKIYADNAATTKMSDNAINAMIPYMKEVYGNPSSLYEIGQKAKESLEDARRRAAEILRCDAKSWCGNVLTFAYSYYYNK